MSISRDGLPPPPLMKGIVNERESQLRLVTSVRLRWMAVLGQLGAIAAVTLLYGFPLNIGSCLVLIAMSAWLNVFLSIRYPVRHRLTTPFAFGLLIYDVLQLAALLYLTGGIQNPFAILLAAPITVASATLPPRYTIFLGSMVIVAGVLLISYHHPLPWYAGSRLELPRDGFHGILHMAAEQRVATDVGGPRGDGHGARERAAFARARRAGGRGGARTWNAAVDHCARLKRTRIRTRQ
jgi:hypothetical protein